MDIEFNTRVCGLDVVVKSEFFNKELDSVCLFVRTKKTKKWRRAKWLENSLTSQEKSQLNDESYDQFYLGSEG